MAKFPESASKVRQFRLKHKLEPLSDEQMKMLLRFYEYAEKKRLAQNIKKA
jgi:hypothetical protein